MCALLEAQALHFYASEDMSCEEALSRLVCMHVTTLPQPAQFLLALASKVASIHLRMYPLPLSERTGAPPAHCVMATAFVSLFARDSPKRWQ